MIELTFRFLGGGDLESEAVEWGRIAIGSKTSCLG